MDVQAVLKQLQQQLEQLVAQAQAQPIAVPAAAALAGLLVAIFLFYNVARAAPRTGSVYQGGVRRSTRRVFNNCGGAAGRSPRAALTGSPLACTAGSTRRRSSTTLRARRPPRRPVQL